MLGLYILASHAVGDFLLQTNHMAAGKFEDPWIRSGHVTLYTLSFIPVAYAAGWGFKAGLLFLAGVWLTHFAVDSRRWAENYEVFPTRALWFDQAYHVATLALLVATVEVFG